MERTSSIKIAAIVGLFVIVIAVAVVAVKNKPTASQTSSVVTTTDSTQSTAVGSSSTVSYKNGTYSASGSYDTPEGSESVNVTLTLNDGLVSDVSTTTSTNAHESRFYQQQFLSGYKAQVVGKSIADLQLTRVSGSSLTPMGFNAALEQIKTQAQS